MWIIIVACAIAAPKYFFFKSVSGLVSSFSFSFFSFVLFIESHVLKKTKHIHQNKKKPQKQVWASFSAVAGWWNVGELYSALLVEKLGWLY